MSPPRTALLGYALLGLLHMKPSSGYDIRKIFAMTPMGSFSDSPGAIYPALRRLEGDGLIRGKIENGSSLRRRKVFHLTAAGTTAFKQWLNRSVTHENVVRNLDELMLRFSFMEQVTSETAIVRFLKAVQRELEAYIPSLREHLDAHKTVLPRSGRLALESGVRSYETLLEWSKYAITSYEKEVKQS
jgi:DNA-binding PadR family transcriptional regulator